MESFVANLQGWFVMVLWIGLMRAVHQAGKFSYDSFKDAFILLPKVDLMILLRIIFENSNLTLREFGDTFKILVGGGRRRTVFLAAGGPGVSSEGGGDDDRTSRRHDELQPDDLLRGVWESAELITSGLLSPEQVQLALQRDFFEAFLVGEDSLVSLLEKYFDDDVDQVGRRGNLWQSEALKAWDVRYASASIGLAAGQLSGVQPTCALQGNLACLCLFEDRGYGKAGRTVMNRWQLDARNGEDADAFFLLNEKGRVVEHPNQRKVIEAVQKKLDMMLESVRPVGVRGDGTTK